MEVSQQAPRNEMPLSEQTVRGAEENRLRATQGQMTNEHNTQSYVHYLTMPLFTVPEPRDTGALKKEKVLECYWKDLFIYVRKWSNVYYIEGAIGSFLCRHCKVYY